jgi:hypothetical protein
MAGGTERAERVGLNAACIRAAKEDGTMHKDEEPPIIEAGPPQSLLALLAILDPIGEDFPPIIDPVPDAIDL